jgi:hypothetical protein
MKFWTTSEGKGGCTSRMAAILTVTLGKVGTLQGSLRTDPRTGSMRTVEEGKTTRNHVNALFGTVSGE